jgi:uncharacterized protein YkwD
VGPAYVGSSCSPRASNPSSGSGAKKTASPSDANGAASRFLSLANGERSAGGYGRLIRNAQLERIALAHAKRMAASGRVYHNEALFYSSTIDSLGNPSMVGENVGRGTSVSGLHDAFMASPDHRANILEGGYGEAGFAVVYGSGQLWVVETFMSRVHGHAETGFFGEDTTPVAKSRVLTFSGPALDAFRWTAPIPELELQSSDEQVLGVSRTIPARVPGGAAGVVVVMALAMVLGAAVPRKREEEEYV